MNASRNVNTLHRAEQAAAGFNTKLALLITRGVGTMLCAYLFTVLALIGLLGLLGLLNPFVFLLTTWISQQFLQLVFLPILSVGQNVLGRHAELTADQTYADTEAERATLAAIQAEQARQGALLDQLVMKARQA
jgi:hypothetical protein